MKYFSKAVFALFFSTLAPLSVAADQTSDGVVLKTPKFEVTVKDFEYYLLEQNIDENRAKQVLSREGAVKSAFENIYVIRAFAEKAKFNPAVDMEEVEWLVESTRQRLLMSRHLELEVAAELENTDWEAIAREEYQADREKYKTGERVSAAHILISTAKRDDEEARALAGEVLTKLEQGEEFENLAKEYSDDPGSKAVKGELGFFGRGKMVKEFEDAAFAMKEPGEISGPVKTRFGYHIIRFNEYKPEEQLSFDKVKGQLIPMVKKKVEQEVRANKINAVKTGAVDLGLEVNTELLEEVEKRYQPAAQ
ncbi:MAG: peptidyl-prolyl cis-trans isomerase [Anaerolineaceae bacterium]|nr:peptidyl-prolyl cis-trans isomerase [Anaerolineaceae bacterium]